MGVACAMASGRASTWDILGFEWIPSEPSRTKTLYGVACKPLPWPNWLRSGAPDAWHTTCLPMLE
eukprot:1881747-Amphidinium_carterae.1